MNALLEAFASFHFLRPAWLGLVPLLLLCGWWARWRERTARPGEGVIAEHLLAALTVERAGRRRVRPSDFMIAAALLCTLAAAGPAWRGGDSPFFSEKAPVVIALETSTSMLATDFAPSRLERAKQKILDLLELRTGARTGLVAYAGSAHAVMPLTDDPVILKTFLEGLEPGIMPVAGDVPGEALKLARGMLESEGQRGTIVLVTDGVPSNPLAAFAAEDAKTNAGTVALWIGPDDDESDGFAALESSGIAVVRSTVDRADVERLMRRIHSNRERADGEGSPAYQDESHWFVLPAALIGLLWYRRGFTMQWMLVGGMLAGLTMSPTVSAALDTPDVSTASLFLDLWLTPDQQARRMLERGEADAAAARFEDPMWRGIAAFRAGDFESAVRSFGRVERADGAYNRGNASVRIGKYREAMKAYARAIELEPDHRAAIANHARVARYLEALDEAREESDTDGKLGADELVFDLEEDEGKEEEIDVNSELDLGSAEQWMRQVETRTRDFLRVRFAIDQRRREADE